MPLFTQIVLSALLTWSLVWATLPGHFGMSLFQDAHPGWPSVFVQACWWVLIALHPIVVGMLWSGGIVWVGVGVITLAQAAFFTIFARDVGARFA